MTVRNDHHFTITASSKHHAAELILLSSKSATVVGELFDDEQEEEARESLDNVLFKEDNGLYNRPRVIQQSTWCITNCNYVGGVDNH